MSGFGALCPFPFRLGGSATEGWTAAQHARLCADIEAVSRTSAAAVVTYTVSSGSVTVHAYRGANGIGLGDAPTITSSGTGLSTITFPEIYETESGRLWSISINGADAGAHATTSVAAEIVATTSNTVQVRTFTTTTGAAVDAKVTVEIMASAPVLGRQPRIGDYDGALDKTDCRTERLPYAWLWYQELESMIGTAFTTSRTSHIHARKLALARNKAAETRAAEKLGANSNPATCDDALGDWVKFLTIPLQGTENRQEIRQSCANAFRFASGNDKASVDEALSALLGDLLIDIQRNYGGSLDSPPDYTFWPTENPGPAAFDLGGGPWLSVRSFVYVRVDRPQDGAELDFLHLMNTQYFHLMDDLMPAWATFNWVTGTDGFLLDESRMDFDGF